MEKRSTSETGAVEAIAATGKLKGDSPRALLGRQIPHIQAGIAYPLVMKRPIAPKKEEAQPLGWAFPNG